MRIAVIALLLFAGPLWADAVPQTVPVVVQSQPEPFAKFNLNTLLAAIVGLYTAYVHFKQTGYVPLPPKPEPAKAAVSLSDADVERIAQRTAALIQSGPTKPL